MADVSKAVDVIIRARDEASAAARVIAASLRTVGTDAGDASTQVNKLNSETQKTKDSASSVDALGTAFKALAASLVVKEFIEANSQLDRFDRAIRAVKGPTADAAAELNYLKGITDTLGLSLLDTAGSYVRLEAASKGTALEGEATRLIFEAVVGAMSALGKSSADTEGALRAVEQIISKGTVQAEELRGQLGDRLPGAFGIAARAVGVTTEELGKMLKAGQLTADEFLPAFARELNNTFGSTEYAETFTAAWNRMKNAMVETSSALGDAGVWSTLTKSVEGLAFVGKLTATELEKIPVIWQAIQDAIARGSLSGLLEALEIGLGKVDAKQAALTRTTDQYNQSAAETARLLRENTEASFGFQESQAETARLLRQAVTPAEELTDALKKLGLDAEDLGDKLEATTTAFRTVAESSEASAEIIGAAFEKAIKKADTLADIETIGGALTEAFTDGKISGEAFGEMVVQLASRQAKVTEGTDLLTGSLKSQEEQLKKQQAETDRAREAAERYALKMEELASNERIKLIEAKVTLDVANIEATTARIQAAYESINNTVTSTGEVISSIIDVLPQLVPKTENFEVALRQLDLENRYREEALSLQRSLTEAQIENLRAQTAQLNSGDALIKVDGSGLEPHLEAIMWELLKAIQIRVNQQGLKLLLGV